MKSKLRRHLFLPLRQQFDSERRGQCCKSQLPWNTAKQTGWTPTLPLYTQVWQIASSSFASTAVLSSNTQPTGVDAILVQVHPSGLFNPDFSDTAQVTCDPAVWKDRGQSFVSEQPSARSPAVSNHDTPFQSTSLGSKTGKRACPSLDPLRTQPWILERMLNSVDESPRLSNTSFVSISFVWHHHRFPDVHQTLAGVGLHCFL